jgi:deoxyhypusine synthase
MKDNGLTTNKTKPIEVEKTKSISQLLVEMSHTGFQGRNLAEACDVLVQMIEDPNITTLMGFSGSLSVAGQWKIIGWLIEQRYIDIIVPTGANITEDIVEAAVRWMMRSYSVRV